MKKKVLLFIAGLASFGISQMVLRVPLLNLFYDTETYIYMSLTMPLVISWIIAFTAGLFEESGRLIFLQFFKKESLSLSDGVVFGLGHGLMEAGWLMISIIGYIVSNGFSSASGLAIVERIFALILQVALTIFVVMAVDRHKIRWYFVAILLHTIMDGMLIYFRSIVALEVSLGCCAAVVLILALVAWKISGRETSAIGKTV